MDTTFLILHVTAAAVLVGGMALLFVAVTPGTELIEDARLRRAVTRVVALRFAWMTVIALVVLVVTGLGQFYSESIVPPDIRENMTDFRWGPVFMVKMTLVTMLVVMVGVHGMYFGPRIGRASELVAETTDQEAAQRLAGLRRGSHLFSLAMLIVGLAVLALGVMLGNDAFSHIRFD